LLGELGRWAWHRDVLVHPYHHRLKLVLHKQFHRVELVRVLAHLLLPLLNIPEHFAFQGADARFQSPARTLVGLDVGSNARHH
jgi:hypothetical protein